MYLFFSVEREMTRRTRSFSADRPHYAYPTCSFLMKCNQTDERFVCCQGNSFPKKEEMGEWGF